MPGLGELDAHIPGGKAPEAEIERTLFLYVANGVTTIRGMLGDPRHLVYRERVGERAKSSARASTPRVRRSRQLRDIARRRRRRWSVRPEGRRATTCSRSTPACRAPHSTRSRSSPIPRSAHPLRRARAARWERSRGVALTSKFLHHRPPRRLRRGAGAERLRVTDLWRQSRRAGGRGPDPGAGQGDTRGGDVAGPHRDPARQLAERRGPAGHGEMARDEVRGARTAWTKWIAQKQGFVAKYPQSRSRRSCWRCGGRLIKALHDGGVPFALGSDAPQTWNVPGSRRTASSAPLSPPG